MLNKYIRCFLWLAIIINCFCVQSIANAGEFIAGEHFKELHAPKISSFQFLDVANNDKLTTNKPQVLMFFNYGCHGCWLINKDFLAWQAANKQRFNIVCVPVASNDVWESLAKLYYVNQELILKDNHEEIFSSIHRDRKKLWLESEIVNFYAQKHIDPQKVLKSYHSFDVARKVKKSIEAASVYGVSVTPNVILNVAKNSYMINFTMVKNPETLFKVIEYLIKESPK